MKLQDIPRIALGFLPTPLEPLGTLSSDFGVRLWAKRDDYTGFGGGGNKVRKLEFLMAEALAQKAQVLITTGGHQSNHARMVAAAARRFGMSPVLVLRGDQPEEYQGNLLLDHLLGAKIVFLDRDEYFTQIGPAMDAEAKAAADSGLVPYVIPLGGANALGAMGYVTAVKEMAEQFKALGEPLPDVIAAPVGSGGTIAGLNLGVRLYMPGTRVVGIAVTTSAVPLEERIATMVNAAAELIDCGDRWSAADIWIENGYVGPGYGFPSELGNEAIRRVAQREGFFLDPVYTGKAMSGVFDLIRGGRLAAGTSVVFVHCGGSPALYPFARELTAAA